MAFSGLADDPANTRSVNGGKVPAPDACNGAAPLP